MKVVVLAGGCGKRLWPLSSNSRPKQFLDVNQGTSLLQQTINRFVDHDILVITNKQYAQITKEQLGPSYGDSILIEPYSKNTAPAICLSIKYLLDKAGGVKEDCCIVCPADHYFENAKDFISLFGLAEQEAQSGNIITFGITPTYPETGYGYIQAKKNKKAFSVTRFIEKPCLKEATKLLEEKSYFWNAGIFVFQIDHFLKELKSHAPEFYEWFLLPYEEALNIFDTLPSISIDHALMEKTDQIKMIPYVSKWSDLGTWNRLSDILSKDDKGNFFSGKIQDIDSKDCMVFGDNISTIGLEGLIIVKNGRNIVICSRDQIDRLSELYTLNTTTN